MKNEKKYSLTHERWEQISQKSDGLDYDFFYGVKTTRIFCRPSCKSRVPRKENIEIFLKTEEALAQGFRPCKRCKPLNEQVPHEEWVDQIKSYIERCYKEPLSLFQIAEECHGSPYHLHRIFAKQLGLTPIEYLEKTRLNNGRRLLEETQLSIGEIARRSGFSSNSHFSTRFKKKSGQTPTEYRQEKKIAKGEE